MAVLTKVMAGCCSTWKKSWDRRWASRSGVPVSMLAAWIVKATVDRSGEASSKVIEPPRSVKRPRTLVTRWRTWKMASEWVLSIANVLTAVAVALMGCSCC